MKHRKGSLIVTLLIVMPLVVSLYWIHLYDNYHCVIDGELYRSAQLSGKELRGYIDKDGLATVINLRTETNANWWAKEKTLCEDEGVMHFDIPLKGDQRPTMEKMAELVGVFQRCERPLLIHCRHGADRTSLAVALYLLERRDRSVDPPSAFSIKYGHMPMIFRHVRCLDEAFARYEQAVLARSDSDDRRQR
ncbi:MAG: tyrosine-protein phosphatase [Kiritimatiellia bacterium]|jgi:protein tyrosine phosphatase (PTP) superfamily phosphohydrolase (DUF442 family)|nr:tyrosine-protein phosphatase [Kiritimatiellia bacterium]